MSDNTDNFWRFNTDSASFVPKQHRHTPVPENLEVELVVGKMSEASEVTARHDHSIESPETRSGAELLRLALKHTSLSEQLAESGDYSAVVDGFGDVIDTLELNDTIFWRNSEAVKELGDYLEKFMEYIDRRIEAVKPTIADYQPDYANFTEGWETRFRQASFFAALTHFSCKRKSEKDRDGNALDYVYHPARVTFDELFGKFMLMDEEAGLLGIIHDTIEDWHKGLIGALHAETEEELAQCREGNIKKVKREGVKLHEAVKNTEQREQVICSLKNIALSFDPEGAESIEDSVFIELLEFLTKTSSNRHKALLAMFKKLYDVLKSGDIKKFKRYLKTFKVKMADRLNNIKSFWNPESLTAEIIEDETSFAFITICRRLGMLNIEDHFVDFIYLKDNEKARVAWAHKNRQIEEETGLQKEFVDELNTRIALELGIPSNNNYPWRIVMRPVSRRAMMIANEKYEGQPPEKHAKAHRSHILVLPTDGDLDSQNEVARAAAIAINGLPTKSYIPIKAPHDLLEEFGLEGTASLTYCRVGDELFNNYSDNNSWIFKHDRYGCVAIHTFDTKRAGIQRMLGYPHALLFYDDDDELHKDALIEAKHLFAGLGEVAEKWLATIQTPTGPKTIFDLLMDLAEGSIPGLDTVTLKQKLNSLTMISLANVTLDPEIRQSLDPAQREILSEYSDPAKLALFISLAISEAASVASGRRESQIGEQLIDLLNAIKGKLGCAPEELITV